MNAPFDIVGIGVAVLDVVMVLDSLPEEEAVVRAQQRSVGLGGGVAVATATISRLGGKAAFVDTLGLDPMSETILATLQQNNVNTESIIQSEGQTASVATIWVDSSSGSRTIVFSPGESSSGVEATLLWNERIEQLVANSKILHLNGRHLEASSEAIRVAKKHSVRVSFDGGAYRYRDEVLPIARQSEILIVAKHFAQSHWNASNPTSPCPEPRELVEFLASDFAQCEIAGVTCGQHGSWLAISDTGEVWHQPSFSANPLRDTTGCGDTYHGAFLYALADGRSPRQCGELASKIASLNAKHLGALSFFK